MKFVIIFLILIGMFGYTLASEPQIIHLEHYQPELELLPEDKIEYGDSFTIHAWLTKYEDKPEKLGYFVDVLDSRHNQVDSTLWFARQDFVYEFDTTHPSYNITKGGRYIIQLERANDMQRTGNIDKILEFEIKLPQKSSNKNDHSELYFQSKNGTNLITLKVGQEIDIIFPYDFRNDKIFDGYVYYNIVENGKLVSQSQNFTISEIPKIFSFSYTPQNTGVFSFTKGSMSHTGIWGGEQGRFITVVDKFSKAMKFNGQCKKPFPEYLLVVKNDFSTAACVKPETKPKLVERGWAVS